MQRSLLGIVILSLLGVVVGCPPGKKPVTPAEPPQPPAVEVVHELVGDAGTSLLVSESGWIATLPRTGEAPTDFEALATAAAACSQGGCGAVASAARIAAACGAFTGGGGLTQTRIGNDAAIIGLAADQIAIAWSRAASASTVLGAAGVELVGALRTSGTCPNCAPCTPREESTAGTTAPAPPRPGTGQPECTWPPIVPPRFCR